MALPLLAEVLATLIALGPGHFVEGTASELARMQESGTESDTSVSDSTGPPTPSPALVRGLDAIRAERFRADLEFFASDAMRGRNTPSPELHIAALYLQSRVQALGFQPGARDGWFQEYPILQRRLDSKGTSLVAEFGDQQVRLQLGEEYFYQLSKQAFDLDLRAAVVCVGSASEEELDGLDVEGKWVLVLDRGKFLSRAIKRCKTAGSAGVIATPGPEYKRDSYSQKYRKRSLDLLQPGKSQLKIKPSKTPPFPVIMLGRETAASLWQKAAVPQSEAGYPVAGSDLGIQLHNRRTVVTDKAIVKNLCAFWPGADPELAQETMIISAHYDHVGIRDGEIFNGADDNASGTSGLLALADAMVAYGPMQRSVMLLWVSGEEKGLWGSKVWVDDPWLPGDAQAVLNVNMDMIGRANPEDLYITPTMDHDSFNKVAQAAYDLAGTEGFGELISQDKFWSASDHMNFDVTLGLPVMFLSAGDHEDYHKPTDTADKIDGDKSARIVRVVLRVLDAMQAAPLSDEK